MIDMDGDLNQLRLRIGVIGVGGSGGNAIARMIRSGVSGVEFVAANTDAQALRASPAQCVIQLGRTLTQGLGAGSRPEIGRAAAEESLPEIAAALEGMHMCFIAAGMGGGTGSGAAPVIARAARELGILTVGVVTRPFGFEGGRRARIAEAGVRELKGRVDTLIVIPNQNLFRVADSTTTLRAAFDLADDVLQQGIRGITDLMVLPGLINLDFADIRAVMSGMGQAMMGTGEASGEDRAMRAAEQAISNPLLDHPLKGAQGLIISIVGGEDMRLMEVDEAAGHIKDMVDPEADIIWGSAFDPALEGRIRVSLVATGIPDLDAEALPAEESSPADVEAAPASVSPPAPVLPARAALSGERDLLFPLSRAESAAAAIGAASLRPTDPADRPRAEAGPETDPACDLLELREADILPMHRPIEPLAVRREDCWPESDGPGPSLFERIASMARGAGRARDEVLEPEDRIEARVA
jgi:cell division protein FtsZ